MPPQLQWACSAQVRSPTTKVRPPSAFWTGGCCLRDPSHSGMGGVHLCHVDPLAETCRRGSGPTSPSAVSGITESWGLKLLCYLLCLQGSDTEEKESQSSVTSSPNDKQIDPALWLWQSKQG